MVASVTVVALQWREAHGRGAKKEGKGRSSSWGFRTGRVEGVDDKEKQAQSKWLTGSADAQRRALGS